MYQPILVLSAPSLPLSTRYIYIINHIGIMMRREVSLVIFLFVLLFAPYHGAERTLTPVNAQQNGISSTSAVNWEEDKETILKVLNKVRSKEIISDEDYENCLLYTSPSPRDRTRSRMPSSA